MVRRRRTVVDKLANESVVYPPSVADRQSKLEGADRLKPAAVRQMEPTVNLVFQGNGKGGHHAGTRRSTGGDDPHQRRALSRCSIVPDRRVNEELDKRKIAEVEPAAVGSIAAAPQGLGGLTRLVGFDDGGRWATGRRASSVVRGRDRRGWFARQLMDCDEGMAAAAVAGAVLQVPLPLMQVRMTTLRAV